jgi:cytochrome c oxidase cbb3-type subunit I
MAHETTTVDAALTGNIAADRLEPAAFGQVFDEAEIRTQRVEIDESCRWPVMSFFVSGLAWLAIGSVLALITSIKMHHPDFLGDWAWLTFGRVRPAHLNTVIYGFASMTGIGVLLWLMCRLCRVPLRFPAMIVIAAVIWNIGVSIGLVALLAGWGTSIEWLEHPTYAAFVNFLSFGIIAVWAVMTFGARREGHVYVSQWYLFGAVFWFPWLYATAQVLMVAAPTAVAGVPHASINWFFAHNVLGVWFTPIGLAAVYYLIPKVIGRPIHSYYLSILGFWSLALFYNWNGAHHLISGPIPAWLGTVSIVASVMMFIPVVTVAINHHMTMRGHFSVLRYSPTLRFIVFGAMAYTAVSLQGMSMSLRVYNEPTHFTHHTPAHAHLGMYGFFAMVMFGSMYYIIPRLTGREWWSSRLIRVHFWSVAVGVLLFWSSLTVGGFIQGFELNQASEGLFQSISRHGLLTGIVEFFRGFEAQNGAVPFLTIMNNTVPWLKIRTGAGLLMATGHVAFSILVIANLLGWGEERRGPTLFHEDAEAYQQAIGGGARGEEAGS